MTDWLLSPIGQAVATWLANALSLVAIIIGVIVALMEQRRANAEKAAEQKREREAIEAAERQRLQRQEKVRSSAVSLLNEAVTIDLPAAPCI